MDFSYFKIAEAQEARIENNEVSVFINFFSNFSKHYLKGSARFR